MMTSTLVQAAMTKYICYSLSTQKFTSHSSGGWKYKIKVPAWLGSGVILFQVAVSRLFLVSSDGGNREPASLWASYKGTSPICEGSILMTELTPKDLTHNWVILGVMIPM